MRRVLDRLNVNYAHDAPESALNAIPLAPPPFRSPGLRMQKFRFPISMPARVALFEGGFEADGAIRLFAAADVDRLEDYVPEAMILPLQLALTLADQKNRGLLPIPALTSAVVVLTSLCLATLAGHHRDLLWQAFRVPVFEQLRGWGGAVIARECEVHDGLHVDPNAVIVQWHESELIATQLTEFEDPIVRIRTGFTADIVNEHCECGLETPRLRNLRSLHTRFPVAMAS